MISIVLTATAFIAGAGAIAADLGERRTLVYVLRPLTMAALIALAALRVPAFPPRYKTLILAGLAASLAGDIFMMLRKKRFMEGLVCFLLAQVLYIGAFRVTTLPRVDFSTALPLLVFASIMMIILFPRAGRLKVPVAVYLTVITIMAGLGIQQYIQIGGPHAFRAYLAAILFVVSDSVLALNRFVKKIPCAQLFILIPYFAAQWLFAMSI